MEGDTPSFLGLLANGLGSPEHPEWGGWGGRYILADASGAQGLYSDAADFAIGANNDTFFSVWATIWRWREAYQYDFAARMQWTVNPSNSTGTASNRQPVAVVNGSCETLELSYTFGSSVILDASQSWDPDGDSLSFDWFHYRDPSFRLEGNIPRISQNVTFDPVDASGSIVNATPNDNEVSPRRSAPARGPFLIEFNNLAQTIHVILTVRDDRTMPLVNYRRIILYPTS